jgi:predicted component of type VI protein secretion system
MNKKTLSVGLLLITCMLCSCHNNPLKANKERQSTRFLINASVAAANRLNPEMDAHQAPYLYLSCMKAKELSMDCSALYVAMADFAKSAPGAEFKGVRAVDLTDREVFESLREGYEERLFYNDLED